MKDSVALSVLLNLLVILVSALFKIFLVFSIHLLEFPKFHK